MVTVIETALSRCRTLLVFYSILIKISLLQILIVLSKMDMSYRQMRNEALLILQIEKLKREVSQKIEVIEFSAIKGIGIEKILDWLE